MPLDDEAPHPATGEKQGRRQADEAAPDDENGRGDFHVTILTNWFSRIKYQDDPSHSLVLTAWG